MPACDPCNEQRPSRDPLASIDRQQPSYSRQGVGLRPRACGAGDYEDPADLPPEAVQEQDAIYEVYAELWQQLRELDAQANEWGKQWGPSLTGEA